MRKQPFLSRPAQDKRTICSGTEERDDASIDKARVPPLKVQSKDGNREYRGGGREEDQI